MGTDLVWTPRGFQPRARLRWQTGTGFVPEAPDPEPLAEPIEPTDTDRIIEALERLLQPQPAPPPVTIDPPDLSAIVTAVNGLKPGATADDVATAVVRQLQPDRDPQNETLDRIVDVLRSLDFRMQAPTAMIGGGILHIDPAQLDINGNIKVSSQWMTQQTGTWSYHAGTSGTLAVPAGQRILGILTHCSGAASMAINGGDSIPLPSGIGVGVNPQGNLVAPTITFTSTDMYFVEVLT